ncbi:MAG TPA: type II CAAX endopeptidase family protein, partial [Anaerolineae bacterium]
VSTVTLSSEASNVSNGTGGLFGSASTLIALTWIQDLYFFLLAGVGVGWLSRRSLAATFRRLGLAVPSWRQVGLGVFLGLAMIPLVFLLTTAAQWLGIPQNADVEKISQALVGPLTQSVVGILTLGLAAALGEEAVFRGALQPRFGLVVTALLFAAMHGQYALSVSTLVVVILGLVLGVVRQRTNTSTSMIVHAVYNASLGLLAYLNIMK